MYSIGYTKTGHIITHSECLVCRWSLPNVVLSYCM